MSVQRSWVGCQQGVFRVSSGNSPRFERRPSGTCKSNAYGPPCLGRRRRSCVNPACFRSAVGNPSPYNFVVLMFSVAFGFIAGFSFDSVFKKLESDHNGSLPPRSALWAKTVA